MIAIDEDDQASSESSDELHISRAGEITLGADTSEVKPKYNFKLGGPIIVADDQHINLEILKQHTINLRV